MNNFKLKNLVVFKGKPAPSGPVHTMNIAVDHIRAVFFPKNFNEKYRYLGSVPWNNKGGDSAMFYAIEPLVVYMDYLAKPWWCPRWFLRFLHLFGNDNSIVRVRNRKLSDLQRRITKGLMIWDYKTKWSEYDLRISELGPEKVYDLARAIEDRFYNKHKPIENGKSSF
jgi:hypothetical protein